MSQLTDAMRTVVAEDARATGDEFASRYGASVTRRVRTRRVARAAGTGALATAAVGALGVGGWRWSSDASPSGGDAETPTASCMTSDEAVDFGLEWNDLVDVGVVEGFGMTLGEGGGPDANVFVSVELHNDGTIEASANVNGVTHTWGMTSARQDPLKAGDSSGGPVVMDLGTEQELAVGYTVTEEYTALAVWVDRQLAAGSVSAEPTITGSIPPRPGGEELMVLDVGELLAEADEPDGLHVLLVDRDRGGHPQALVHFVSADEATVDFADGSSTTVGLGDDGIATFDWAGVGVISLDPATGLPETVGGVEATAPVDAVVSGPFVCDVSEPGNGPELNVVFPETYDPR